MKKFFFEKSFSLFETICLSLLGYVTWDVMKSIFGL